MNSKERNPSLTTTAAASQGVNRLELQLILNGERMAVITIQLGSMAILASDALQETTDRPNQEGAGGN